MRFGIDISPAGAWGDPRTLAELAALAERSGWDGVFVEDYLVYQGGGEPTYDPWIALAAVALATERITLGTMVTPLPRRRPWKVAAEAMTIDHLSGGRFVLGVGSGDPDSPDTTSMRTACPCGLPPAARTDRHRGHSADLADPKIRAEILDESLDILAGLWSGEPFSYTGRHYQVDEVTLRPAPVQRPRIPIWVGGQFTRRGPRERAVRWDGSCLYRATPPMWEDIMPVDIRALRDAVREQRGTDEGYDIAVGGRHRRADEDAERRYVASIAAAGATWWHEFLSPADPLDTVREHIARGPLRDAVQTR